MHVGVFPIHFRDIKAVDGLPHARGGVSADKSFKIVCTSSSPCTWGCFYGKILHWIGRNVFPMHVGVFPMQLYLSMPERRLPHARGGVSMLRGLNFLCAKVFPMHVGVFLQQVVCVPFICSLPHARGGVSNRLMICFVQI